MDEFEITLTGITDSEYHQARQLNNRRIFKMLAIIMVLICGIIILVTGNASVNAILGPFFLYVLFVVAVEILTRRNYKGQLSETEPVVYRFDEKGWSVTAGGGTAEFEWRVTEKLKDYKDGIFLYNDSTSGNLLPKRLLTEAQIAQIKAWFKGSRKAAREYDKEEFNAYRKEFREEHQNLMFGRRGPSWGPWKKK